MTKHIEFSTRHWLYLGLFVLLVAYAVFQARFLILGPQISITSPTNGSRATTSVITLEGQAENIAYISLNDRNIFIDEKGKFEEKVVVHPGLSIITMRAKDRFGRGTEKQVKIVYYE